MVARLAPDPQPRNFGAGLGAAITAIGTIAPIHRCFPGLDHRPVDEGATGRIDDLSKLGPWSSCRTNCG